MMFTTIPSSAARRRLAIFTAVCLLALPVSACSSDENAKDNETPSEAEIDDAMLDYAQCMREHGVPMKDPQPGEGGTTLLDEDDETVRKAKEACDDILEDADALPDDEGFPAEEKEAMLAEAQCMREHGWDVADPTSDGSPPELGPNVDTDDPQFDKDQQECDAD